MTPLVAAATLSRFIHPSLVWSHRKLGSSTGTMVWKLASKTRVPGLYSMAKTIWSYDHLFWVTQHAGFILSRVKFPRFSPTAHLTSVNFVLKCWTGLFAADSYETRIHTQNSATPNGGVHWRCTHHRIGGIPVWGCLTWLGCTIPIWDVDNSLWSDSVGVGTP